MYRNCMKLIKEAEFEWWKLCCLLWVNLSKKQQWEMYVRSGYNLPVAKRLAYARWNWEQYRVI